jgi:hypothetical protein
MTTSRVGTGSHVVNTRGLVGARLLCRFLSGGKHIRLPHRAPIRADQEGIARGCHGNDVLGRDRRRRLAAGGA